MSMSRTGGLIRYVNELRVAEIRTVAAATRYLRDRLIPDDNASCAHAPADPTSAFVPFGPCSSWASGAPNNAMIPSPMTWFTVPS